MPPPYAVHNTTSVYSCVAIAGWDARVQWINGSGDDIPVHNPNDTNLPSIYVTYSIFTLSKEVKTENYTGHPFYSIHPVHNVTLHLNGIPYHGDERFTCRITGVNMGVLRKYKVPNNFTYYMTVNVTELPLSSNLKSSTSLSAGPIAGIAIGATLVMVTIALLVILVRYGKFQRSRNRKLSISAPFGQFTVESVDLKSVTNNKMQFPKENITLLEVIGMNVSYLFGS